MASRLIRAITALPLALAFFFIPEPAPARAEASVFQSPVQLHTFKFYLDPALAPDMAFAKAVLPKYIADMNTVLAKNTNRQLAFDPETGIILTDTKPETGNAAPPLPTEGFEIWAHVIPATTFLSYGGYASLDISGAGVVDGMHWTRLYDPDQLGTGDVLDYTKQISTLLHELAHVFGAGIGEYYSLTHISDTTNTEPLLGIDLFDAHDAYWSDKQDFMADPLLQLTLAGSREEYLAKAQYSSLTAAVLNGAYRNGIPSFDRFTVQALDEDGLPVAEANVKVWSVVAGSPFPSQLLDDVQTDETGQVTVSWGGAGGPHNVLNLLRLIKVYRDGAALNEGRYVSVFDADSAQLVRGQSSFVVTMRPPAFATATFTSTATSDGSVLESGVGTNKGGGTNAGSTRIKLGNTADNRRYRSVLAFDTGSLPDNAVITKVTLKVRREGVTGGDPFARLGDLVVDMGQPWIGSRAGLQAGDFQAQAGLAAAAKFTRTPDADGWYSAVLKDTALSAVSLGGATQFRLRFSRSANTGAEYLTIYSGDAAAGNRPVLVVEYEVKGG